MRRTFSTVSAVSGALAFGLLMAQAMVAVQVLPHLIDLLRTAPRLAFAGFLAIVLFPGVVVVVGHHIGHQLLDSYDPSEKRRAIFPKAESWWAGALAYLVMYGTSILTRLTYLIVNPPPPEDDALSLVAQTVTQTIEEHAHLSNAFTLYAALWIATATGFFELERRTRKA